MLTELLISTTESLFLPGRKRLQPSRERQRSDRASNPMRGRVYREALLLSAWTGLLFVSSLVLVGGGALVDAVTPMGRRTWAVTAGLLGAFCFVGLLLHLLRYAVLLVVGLARTGELIGASRRVDVRGSKAAVEEPAWFVTLTKSTDVDLLLQLGVAVMVGFTLVGHTS